MDLRMVKGEDRCEEEGNKEIINKLDNDGS